MSALVGLDVGTSGVKALAVGTDGEVLARAERGYPLSTPQSGLGRAGSRGLGARGRGGTGRPEGRRGGRHRALRADARPGRPRRGRARPAPGDPLERPAHGRRVRGDRGAHRARAPGRADPQPRADGLHRPEAPLAAPPRARRLRADRARPPPEGLRPPGAHGRAGDRRRRRLGNAPLRRRVTALERRGARGARAAGRVAPARARVARGLGRDRGRRACRRGRRRPGRRGGRRGRARARACVGRPRDVRRRLRSSPGARARPGGPRARLLPRRARRCGTRWG